MQLGLLQDQNLNKDIHEEDLEEAENLEVMIVEIKVIVVEKEDLEENKLPVIL